MIDVLHKKYPKWAFSRAVSGNGVVIGWFGLMTATIEPPNHLVDTYIATVDVEEVGLKQCKRTFSMRGDTPDAALKAVLDLIEG